MAHVECDCGGVHIPDSQEDAASSSPPPSFANAHTDQPIPVPDPDALARARRVLHDAPPPAVPPHTAPLPQPSEACFAAGRRVLEGASPGAAGQKRGRDGAQPLPQPRPESFAAGRRVLEATEGLAAPAPAPALPAPHASSFKRGRRVLEDDDGPRPPAPPMPHPSAESFAKARRLLEGDGKGSGPVPGGAFMSAGSKPIKAMSDASLAKARELLGDVFDPPAAPPPAGGFASAGSKPIKPVSQAALARARELLGDPMDTTADDDAPTASSALHQPAHTPVPGMFSTAGNKPVQAASKASLDKARQLVGDLVGPASHGDNDNDNDDDDDAPPLAPPRAKIRRTLGNETDTSTSGAAGREQAAAAVGATTTPFGQVRSAMPVAAGQTTRPPGSTTSLFSPASTRRRTTRKFKSPRRLSVGSSTSGGGSDAPGPGPVTPRGLLAPPMLPGTPITPMLPATPAAPVIASPVVTAPVKPPSTPMRALGELTGGHALAPYRRGAVAADVVAIDSVSAAEHEFSADLCRRHGMVVSSGVGWERMQQLLEASGADPGLISGAWVRNHFRWIVWKLASMERRLPAQVGPEYLNPGRVLAQLQHRYEREINGAQRPVLRKICERDESPAVHMVLCVSRVLQGRPAQISVTDGWYELTADLDDELARHLAAGRIFVGLKLHVVGAQLSGSDIACHPLDVQPSTGLRLHVNGTRRAAWATKLGRQREHAFLVNLRSVRASGGMLPCINVVVLRQYPVVYMEALPDGSKVVRSEDEEATAAQAHAASRQDAVARSQSKRLAEAVVDAAEGMGLSEREHRAFGAIVSSGDGDAAGSLGPDERARFGEFRAEVQRLLEVSTSEFVMSTAGMERDVRSLLKVKIADEIGDRDMDLERQAVVSFYRPSDEVLQTLREGARVRIFGLQPRQSGGDLHLASTRATKCMPMRGESPLFYPRVPLDYGSIGALSKGDDFDTVGIFLGASAPQPMISQYGRPVNMVMVALASEDGVLVLQRWVSQHAQCRRYRWAKGTPVAVRNASFRQYDSPMAVYVGQMTEVTEITHAPKDAKLAAALAGLAAWKNGLGEDDWVEFDKVVGRVWPQEGVQ